MIVVSDTTPIISLLKCHRLEILKELFKEIVIPEAVYDELTSNEKFPEEAAAIQQCDFIKTVTLSDRKLLDIFQRATGLDLGESEAIIYSDENSADLLMMDEVKGRRVAKQMNIKVIGTLGILQLANEKELLSGSDVRDCIDALRSSSRHISEELIQMVMDHIKE